MNPLSYCLRLAISLCFFLIYDSARGQSARSDEALEVLDREIRRMTDNGDMVGGEVLIIRGHQTIFHESYGWSDREKEIPLKKNSLWSIMSMSKPFTAVAIMMLVEEGKLSLNDRVIDYIPEYAGNPETTIAHLLSHSSGYQGYDYRDYRLSVKSLGEWVEKWSLVEPSGTFGVYDYTNFGFAACGYIVEKLTGDKIEEFITARIIKPLGLKETFTGFPPDPADRSQLHTWYRWNDDVKHYLIRYERDEVYMPYYPAAWGMFSTAKDYAFFLQMILNGGSWQDKRFLTPESVKEMLRMRVVEEGPYGYGLGWKLEQPPKAIVGDLPDRFGHGGSDGTLGDAYIKDSVIVIIMTQSEDGYHRQAISNWLPALNVVFTFPKEEATTEGIRIESISNDQLIPYTGLYRGDIPGNEGGEFLIRAEVFQPFLLLKINAFGRETGTLLKLAGSGDDRFFRSVYDDRNMIVLDSSEVFHFSRDETGAIESIEISVGGDSYLKGRKVREEEVQIEMTRNHSRIFVHDLVKKEIEEKGIPAARKFSQSLFNTRPDSVVFHNSLLNSLGYTYLYQDEYENAIAVFEINIEAYPDVANCYNSMADAWRYKGDPEKVEEYLNKAREIANSH